MSSFFDLLIDPIFKTLIKNIIVIDKGPFKILSIRFNHINKIFLDEKMFIVDRVSNKWVSNGSGRVSPS